MAEESDAVEVSADGDVFSIAVSVIVLEQLVADEEGGNRHCAVIDGEGGAGGETRPEIVLGAFLQTGMLTGTGIHHADHGHLAGGGIVGKVHRLRSRVQNLTHEDFQVPVNRFLGSVCAIVGVGLRDAHLRHHLEGRRELPVAHLLVEVSHRTAGVSLVVIALLVEEASDLLNGGRVLEVTIRELRHHHGNDGGTDTLDRTVGRKSELAETVGSGRREAFGVDGLHRRLLLQKLHNHI